MNLIRARDVMGLPVVSIASGEDVAEIRDVVYDGEAHRLVGFTLNKRGTFAGRLKNVLAARSVTAIGPDAVMIDAEAAIDGSGDRPAGLDDLGAARPVIGNRVLSADGSDLGEVVAVILSTGDEPCAVGYELQPPDRADTSFVPISAQMALSGENLVLPAEATAFVRDDLAGFGAAVASYRSPELENDR
ncbi:MAG TPA: PRC-barrel domain-containing protein [Acidimicrobiales bacterium]|nr:PRC-barrel domain-containing protein [Acidimicrobiales bacterium]